MRTPAQAAAMMRAAADYALSDSRMADEYYVDEYVRGRIDCATLEALIGYRGTFRPDAA